MTNRDQLSAHLQWFKELGVAGVSRESAWREREDITATNVGEVTPLSSKGVEQPVTGGTLQNIRNELGDCTRCKLHELGRKQIVFGTGDEQAKLMFVGEAPGRDEDIKGIPFVGRAGQLLTKIIESIDLSRESVYIANVIKCRPPQNRNPEVDEVETCQPFLFSQIDAIKPKVIVALGTFAAQTLLESSETISRLRGNVYEYRGASLIPTFHPAFLLRSPSRKRDVWEDMKKVRELLNSSG
jgi:DNA polymerase